MSKNSTKIGLVMGGSSAERKVSINTGKQCFAALQSLGHDVFKIRLGRNFISDLKEKNPDMIFNALHGHWGEDGTIQGCLEWLRIPYTHSGVLASALAMNKQKSREIFKFNGLPVAEGFIIKSDEIIKSHPMNVPYVIKPNNEGSSVGVHIIRDITEKINIRSENLPKVVLIEEFIPGRELTVTIMGSRALEVTEIKTSSWYDFKAKYDQGGSTHITPAEIPSNVRKACMEIALKAHKSLGCRGVTRADFRWNETLGVSGLVILEINTQPGMTKTSLVPEQAAACDISFESLCQWIVEDASCNR